MSIDEQIGRIVLAHQEGREEGRGEERKRQEEERRMERVNLIKKNLQKGKTPEDVSDFLDIPLSQVLEIQREH